MRNLITGAVFGATVGAIAMNFALSVEDAAMTRERGEARMSKFVHKFLESPRVALQEYADSDSYEVHFKETLKPDWDFLGVEQMGTFTNAYQRNSFSIYFATFFKNDENHHALLGTCLPGQKLIWT